MVEVIFIGYVVAVTLYCIFGFVFEAIRDTIRGRA